MRPGRPSQNERPEAALECFGRGARASDQHESIPMNYLIRHMRQQLTHVSALQPNHLWQLPRRVVGDSLANYLAVESDLHRVASVKVPVDFNHTDRKEAGAALAQHASRTGIDRKTAMNRLRVLEPELEARRLRAA